MRWTSEAFGPEQGSLGVVLSDEAVHPASTGKKPATKVHGGLKVACHDRVAGAVRRQVRPNARGGTTLACFCPLQLARGSGSAVVDAHRDAGRGGPIAGRVISPGAKGMGAIGGGGSVPGGA